VAATVQTLNPKGTNGPVPIDLATASGSGLDPDISPAAAFYQVARVAAERHVSEDAVRSLVTTHITPRQFGLLGEPRVNVLELNLDLDNHPSPPIAALSILRRFKSIYTVYLDPPR
jgi:K+-transporting ATPase ATPase C chain